MKGLKKLMEEMKFFKKLFDESSISRNPSPPLSKPSTMPLNRK
jgi:hypothetical protein